MANTHPIVYLRCRGISFPYEGGVRSSLLELLLAHQIAVEFQCLSGFCGSCRLRLNAGSGQVKYYKEPLAFVNRKEILPCCCFPLDDIELEL
ncbi:class I ribonucleotide reductase maintenance protein YfaE [Sodalis sp. CWE]|uniref:class I ribonucleotide reductase maintenance protein YfaE n=1 Tax=Sodalis sp. CWE TaxID=2803816 RepID=UPI001C7CCE43|nr:class I ribonucleotide reductase maintenance protein YfaE [Sodalis sp. CWE]MBX4181067.1 2Fe-2S ferredoxin-like protein [Sodalis sp. CWE]